MTLLVDADDWQFYEAGIMKPSCDEANHAVLFVGMQYKKAKDQLIFKFKNSWGANWGERGYIRVDAANANDCGYWDQGVIPNPNPK